MPTRRVTGLLATNIFLSGAAFAAMTPYRAIVGVDELGLSNAAFGTIMALTAVGSACASVALGWLSDKVADRRVLIFLCAVMGVVAFGLIWAIQTPFVFVLAFCLLVPFGNALFSQSFSYSRAFYNRTHPERAEFILSLLRSMFTLAWIVVPPLAGLIAARWSAYSVFAFSAVAHVGCTLVIGLLWLQPNAKIGVAASDPDTPADPPPRIRIATPYRFGIIGVTCAMAAVQLNMVLLPLVILRDLNGSLAQVGINASIAAAIEVPAMIGWGYLAMRVRKDVILAVASALFALYFGLMLFVGSFLQVVLLQAIAAVAIAALLSINISYLQEAIPSRVGLSTSLVDLSRVVSVWIAAAVFSLNSAATYTPFMAVAALLSLAGAALMLLAARSRRLQMPG
ncbi:MAG: MFS transporter [Tabrizicola sp.]|uniref:MFS transporter n=1 Tax=Tabrizicola sp. TaxID=2005166 RepID=UPI002ABCC148|nr:MFS transporter [Tabrizicola sp.]MDZ4085960.1 MFS transporter [Tabrizicola sp.]